jgi:hypothetical protein
MIKVKPSLTFIPTNPSLMLNYGSQLSGPIEYITIIDSL